MIASHDSTWLPRLVNFQVTNRCFDSSALTLADAAGRTENLGEVRVVLDFDAKVRVPVAVTGEDQRQRKENRQRGKRLCGPPFGLPEGAANRADRPRDDGFAAQETFEVGRQFLRRLIAPPRIFLQTFLDDRFQVDGNCG